MTTIREEVKAIPGKPIVRREAYESARAMAYRARRAQRARDERKRG